MRIKIEKENENRNALHLCLSWGGDSHSEYVALRNMSVRGKHLTVLGVSA